MMRKYIVPEEYKRIFDNNNVIYCKIVKTLTVDYKKVHLVKTINNNKTYVFEDNELLKLNLLDRIKMLKYKEGN